MMPIFTEDWGNPSSLHSKGREAKNLLDDLSYSIDISDAEKYKEYIVASREADLITKRAARLISLGVNLALQPSVSPQDMAILVT